jgi:hypothetical protein
MPQFAMKSGIVLALLSAQPFFASQCASRAENRG